MRSHDLLKAAALIEARTQWVAAHGCVLALSRVVEAAQGRRRRYRWATVALAGMTATAGASALLGHPAAALMTAAAGAATTAVATWAHTIDREAIADHHRRTRSDLEAIKSQIVDAAFELVQAVCVPSNPFTRFGPSISSLVAVDANAQERAAAKRAFKSTSIHPLHEKWIALVASSAISSHVPDGSL